MATDGHDRADHGSAKELLEHPAEYLYPTSDKAPALSRDNLEDIFLTPVHVRLFNLCMPTITDFTQVAAHGIQSPICTP